MVVRRRQLTQSVVPPYTKILYASNVSVGMAVDWLSRIGRKGFEALIAEIMDQRIEKALKDRVDPRFTSIENRLVGIENRLAAIETRLDVADRLAKLEAEVAVLKQRS